jgi:hypothetical protein
MTRFDFGPVEFVTITFDGEPTPQMATAVSDLAKAGTIRLLDLVLVTHHADGRVEITDIEDVGDGHAFSSIRLEASGLAAEDDIVDLARATPAGSSARLRSRPASSRASSRSPAQLRTHHARFAATPSRGSSTASRTYALLALGVPTVGLVLAAVQDRLGDVWIVIAMVLTAVAGGLLALRIVPLQADTLRGTASTGDPGSLRMLTGMFNLLWVAVVVLMVLRPGAEA